MSVDREPVIETTRSLAARRTICAYCGGRAVYLVRSEHWAACCCEEPTHWTWLIESAMTFERETR